MSTSMLARILVDLLALGSDDAGDGGRRHEDDDKHPEEELVDDGTSPKSGDSSVGIPLSLGECSLQPSLESIVSVYVSVD